MKIDITAPEGNTFAALGIATQFMRQARRDAADIVALRKAVMSAQSAKEARAAITEATFGSIEFYDPREDDQ
jgi:thiamine monophosphate synthase